MFIEIQAAVILLVRCQVRGAFEVGLVELLIISDQCTPGLKRLVKPFMEVERYRVCLVDTLIVVFHQDGSGSQCTVSTIDMIPHAVRLSDPGQGFQRIDGSCIHGTGVTNQAKRFKAPGYV